MVTILKITIISLLALAFLGGGSSSTKKDSITPDRACAPGDAEACKASGGEWYPKNCTCL